MDYLKQFREQFERIQAASNDNGLGTIRQNAFSTLSKLGIPTAKNEEWKYTRISSLFNTNYDIPFGRSANFISDDDLASVRLPGMKPLMSSYLSMGYFRQLCRRLFR